MRERCVTQTTEWCTGCGTARRQPNTFAKQVRASTRGRPASSAPTRELRYRTVMASACVVRNIVRSGANSSQCLRPTEHAEHTHARTKEEWSCARILGPFGMESARGVLLRENNNHIREMINTQRASDTRFEWDNSHSSILCVDSDATATRAR
jgi:hypothetical protein